MDTSRCRGAVLHWVIALNAALLSGCSQKESGASDSAADFEARLVAFFKGKPGHKVEPRELIAVLKTASENDYKGRFGYRLEAAAKTFGASLYGVLQEWLLDDSQPHRARAMNLLEACIVANGPAVVTEPVSATIGEALNVEEHPIHYAAAPCAALSYLKRGRGARELLDEVCNGRVEAIKPGASAVAAGILMCFPPSSIDGHLRKRLAEVILRPDCHRYEPEMLLLTNLARGLFRDLVPSGSEDDLEVMEYDELRELWKVNAPYVFTKTQGEWAFSINVSAKEAKCPVDPETGEPMRK